MHFLGDKNTINFHSLSLYAQRERERESMLVGESYNLVENVTGDGLVSNVKIMELAPFTELARSVADLAPMFMYL